MKIEQLLVQHFYNTKQVTLQGVGTFRLTPDFIMPQDNDKDISIPAGAISFEYNSRAKEDESLIDFIVQQTRKIRPLASSDLESYLMLASQFLNIGKPFKIDGIGVLEKNQLGEFHFIQEGQFMNALKEETPLQVREKSGDDISFTSKTKTVSGNNGKKIIAIAAAVVVLAAVGTAAWYFLSRKKTTEPVAQTANETPAPALPAQDTAKKDTAAAVVHKPDSLAMLQPVATTNTAAGGYTFKIVFKVTTNKAAAVERMNTLIARGHKVILYNQDSVTYKLAEPFNLPLSDTAKVKDSLNRFFYVGKAKVELN